MKTQKIEKLYFRFFTKLHYNTIFDNVAVVGDGAKRAKKLS